MTLPAAVSITRLCTRPSIFPVPLSSFALSLEPPSLSPWTSSSHSQGQSFSKCGPRTTFTWHTQEGTQGITYFGSSLTSFWMLKFESQWARPLDSWFRRCRGNSVAISLRPPACSPKPGTADGNPSSSADQWSWVESLMFQKNLRYFPSYFRSMWKFGCLNRMMSGVWIRVPNLRKSSPPSFPKRGTWHSIIVQPFFLNSSHSTHL